MSDFLLFPSLSSLPFGNDVVSLCVQNIVHSCSAVSVCLSVGMLMVGFQCELAMAVGIWSVKEMTNWLILA